MLLSQVPGYYKQRREALMRSNPGAAFILPSGEEMLRNPDVHHPFRQESSFYYLTGFEEPESVLLLLPSGSKGGTHRTLMFVRQRDVEREMWDGERYGTDRAMSLFGADEAHVIADFDQKLPELLKGVEKVFYRLGNPAWDSRMLAGLESLRRSQGRAGKSLAQVQDPNEVIGEMRLFKSADEAQLMREACRITALAHKTAMQEVRPGMNEAEVEALIDYVMRKNGCRRMGYGSIVAGGKNAACLHYRDNNDSLRDGDLLLIDAGGEYGYYTSDITRTFPVGKTFSAAQAWAYDLVLEAQLAACDMAKPGATLPGIHRRVQEIIVEGCLKKGLFKGSVDDIISSGQFRRFFPHGTSHWLGMDVHDVGLYLKNGEARKLEPGMCFTIEPGFYVQPADRDTPEQFHGIGIRIEDDILITASGHENLTKDAPKLRAEIEALKR